MLPSTGRVSYNNASGSQLKSNTRNDRIQRPLSRSEKNKLEAQHRKFKYSSNKNNHVLDCNANVKNVDLSSNSANIVEIVLWYLDSRCSKHMAGQRDRLINFVSKFIGTVRFGNDNFAAIIGYVRKFYDSDLEVAFRKHTSFVRNLDYVDLLSGSRSSNLYTISLKDMMKSSPICLLSKSSKIKSWLWHRCLSHLNFNTINHLAKQDLVRGLPKLKYDKDHLCYACQMRKSKKKSHKPKLEPSLNSKLHMLHMDLCGPMRVESINGKKYILVIVGDYSLFTWVKLFSTKDETPKIIIKFLKQAQVSLQATVQYLHTNNDTEFINQTLIAYMKDVGITHETSAKAVATACYTQNRSLIHTRYNKTSYELLRDQKPDLKFLHVFGELCYPINNSEDLGKLKPKSDIGIFIGYSPSKKAYRIYSKRTRMIIETIHVHFDELTQTASE
ncbi:retrovirus-related pol polyprotein from transposon TNT 1-94 [Tanacetum coccineum]|uniref:Retrovirus-related pol polyprotein from transposon TNT 1-94 n=1 Tax=Tanacetum coccineum TaxID=301880 RepID=A0ABQ5FLX0_9ASTR